MAGNKRGPEGVFSSFLTPILQQVYPLTAPVENEIGRGMSDIYVAGDIASCWIEIKSIEYKSTGMMDLKHFTADQRNFLTDLPSSVGGLLVIEVMRGTNKDDWFYLIYGKNDLPPAQTKSHMDACLGLYHDRRSIRNWKSIAGVVHNVGGLAH